MKRKVRREKRNGGEVLARGGKKVEKKERVK